MPGPVAGTGIPGINTASSLRPGTQPSRRTERMSYGLISVFRGSSSIKSGNWRQRVRVCKYRDIELEYVNSQTVNNKVKVKEQLVHLLLKKSR